MTDAPVFIVGTPRSGTTLLAASLCAHPHLHCGPETNFFRKLPKFFNGARPFPGDWPERVVDFVTSIRLQGQQVHELYGQSREDIRRYLASRPASQAAALEALTRQFAAANGKTRWVEKSPKHLHHVADIRNVFPDAPIIRVVRDPRDVALSIARTPWGANSLLYNVYVCVDDVQKSDEFFQADHKATTILYESLVRTPSATLRSVCDFIGEDFHHDMLEAHKAAHFVASPMEPWKQRNFMPIDTFRAGAWKRNFPEDLVPAAEMICRERFEKFGYEFSHDPARTMWFHVPDYQNLKKLQPLIAEAARNGTCLRPVSDCGRFVAHRPPDRLLVLETPYFGRNPLQRMYSLLRFGCRLIGHWLRLEPPVHIDGLVRYDYEKGPVYRPARALIRLLTRQVPVAGDAPVAGEGFPSLPTDPAIPLRGQNRQPMPR